jgi:hypothetical protein
MKNLESIINRDMVDWLFTTIEIILKDDILVTLPKKKYEKMLVQDLLQLIKSYPGFLDIKSTIIPLISLTGSILQHTTSLELGDSDLIDYLKVKALTKGSHISTSSSVILERFTGNSNSANQRILSEDLKFVEDLGRVLFSEIEQLLRNASDIANSPVQHLLHLLINIAGPNQKCPKVFQTIDIKGVLQHLFQMCPVIVDVKEEAEKWIDIHSLMLVLLINILGKEGSKTDSIVDFGK